MSELAKFLGVSACEVTELLDIYPLLGQQTIAEIKDTIVLLCEFGVSPLDAKSFIWVTPSIFTLTQNELRELLTKKQRWCNTHNQDFVQKIYEEPDFLINDN